MLSVSVLHGGNRYTVMPMRPDYPQKSFSSEDVPHGTNSVLVSAVASLNANYGLNIPLPLLSEQQINEMVLARKAEIADEEVTQLPIPPVTPVSLPQVEESGDLITPEMIEAKKQSFFMSPVDDEQARALIIEEKKTQLARAYIEKRIAAYLDVALTEEARASWMSANNISMADINIFV